MSTRLIHKSSNKYSADGSKVDKRNECKNCKHYSELRPYEARCGRGLEWYKVVSTVCFQLKNFKYMGLVVDESAKEAKSEECTSNLEQAGR